MVCRNWQDDRIIPRMARAMADRLGWGLGKAVDPHADVLHLTGYFEAQLVSPWPKHQRVAAYFSHREEEPPGNAKARLWDETAGRVQLRVATCRLYADQLAPYGRTAICAAPLDRDHFRLARRPARQRPVVGFSGYTYTNRRKGEDLATQLLRSPLAARMEWRASGRGWPVPTTRYSWEEMPAFYQGLDVLVCTSRVEGIPMPPLEALATGCRVVIPRGVGLLDELPDVPGIYRYARGDVASLLCALEMACFATDGVSEEALREATACYSVERWVEDHRRAFAEAFGEAVEPPAMTLAPTETRNERSLGPVSVASSSPTASTRGIYCVAFGGPARAAAQRMMTSAKRHMPDIPIALCAAEPIGPEDVLIVQPDSDVGARRAKLRAYELAPSDWQAVLYLDADTEIVAPVYRFFEWIEDGWEFVVTKDPHLMDTMHAYGRSNNAREMDDLQRQIRTLNTLQWNGGVWAFGRGERVAAFFRRWQEEWERYAQRDQGPLIRAMYADPLKVLVLGNEWNTFPKYSRGVTTAGIMHYPGEARRWEGLIPGRIDAEAAWDAVKRYERTHAR